MEFDQKRTEALIGRIRNHDESAFQDFYEEWYPKAYYIALAITHHEADAKDVAQETMIEIHRSLDHLRDLKYFKLWLNRIILSKCNRIFRKKKAVTMDIEQHNILYQQREERTDFLPQDHIHMGNDQDVLRQMLNHLKPIYAEVLVLMYMEQCSIKEIADILQVPEGTVKSRLSSAKEKLRAEIYDYEQKEQIKLNFHGRSLETMLAMAYAEMAHIAFVPNQTWMTKGNNVFSFLTSHVMIGVLSVVIAVCGVKAGSEWMNTVQRANEMRFVKPITLKDIEIRSEKDAYYALMKYAHCEVELAELNAQERSIVNDLLNQIQYPGSVYYALWEKRK